MRAASIFILRGSLNGYRNQKAHIEYAKDCEDALLNSELGRRYFEAEGSVEKPVVENLESGGAYVALLGGECAEFMYLMLNGAFVP